MRAAVAMGLLFAVLASAVADEKGAERAFNRARGTDPELMVFLKRMPKGGDLHNHASGAAYTDYMLDAAIKAGLYFDPATAQFGTDSSKVPAKNLLTNNALLYRFLNAASMRGWMGGGQSGHDHFFDTFGIFGGALNAVSESDFFTEVIGRAKSQNLQYMELMAGPAPSAAISEYMKDLPSSADMEKALAVLRARLPKLLEATKANLDLRDTYAARIGQRSYTGAGEPITVRWIHSINRLAPADSFFANAAAGIYLAANEPRVAAMNMVAPEDHPLSRQNFDSQMRMIDFLWRNLGRPNLTLHGGELTPAISPPESMRDRIRKTIELGHARRIGHGVSIAWEENAEELLAKMRREGIAVEICLTSNMSILGVSREQHPFKLYRRAGVPVFLNTDDEGVSRSTMTLEWIRGIREQGLGYLDLKDMARNSIEYSFLPGRSLYDGRNYAHLVGPFKDARKPGWKPGAEAARMLGESQKMRVQLRLERAFVEFENRYP
jgi:adenosine deaminase